MIIIQLSKDEGVLLRKALKPLVIVERMGTIRYTPDGFSLIVSEQDGFVIAALQIKSSDIDYFNCNWPSASAGINLANLYDKLLRFGDECLFSMVAEDEAIICLQCKSRRTGAIIYSTMKLSEVAEEHADIDGRLQFEYEAVIGIHSAEFRRILSKLIHRDKKAFVLVTKEVVMVYGSADGFFLRKEFGECIVGGVGEEVIQMSFSLVEVISYQEASALSSFVWILHSKDGPPVLNCPVGAIGNLMFYFMIP
ncbi:hypothetical protein Patl1_05074 [Pistacia atlantica]|uniref:Uncharacterized protein n=1 Tax=Pistacia atlantica TaxID=434234 RepID=A0ACC1BVY2_9ROSI|nr:hypothetical protein Patl1_05074 [Pistacia atlantica]